MKTILLLLLLFAFLLLNYSQNGLPTTYVAGVSQPRISLNGIWKVTTSPQLPIQSTYGHFLGFTYGCGLPGVLLPSKIYLRNKLNLWFPTRFI